MLLAHQIRQMLVSGQAKDLNQISEWLGVSKARLDQITNMLYLCPKIQEALICGDSLKIEKISEYALRPIAIESDWQKQMAAWNILLTATSN